MSRIAVWLNNYNNEKHIAKAIESVLAQTYTDFVAFVFDNHSKDGAPAIIRKYADANPGKLVAIPMPSGLAGIPAMKFAWDYLNKLDFDCSITLGGHDYWPQTNHLEILVSRMEHERRGQECALVYTDTWQVNEDDEIVGRFNNIMQQGGNMALPFIPQWVVTGIDCPPFFGLWNEKVRKQVPIRHTCAGFDHLVVANAALHGTVMWEPRTVLRMRAPLPGSNMELYGKKHFSPAALQSKDRDFRNQLEWLTAMVDEATRDSPAGHRQLLLASMFATYVCLRGYNLSAFPGALEAFNANPDAQRAIHACLAAAESVRRLTV